jgi:hypothetical protein
LPATNGYAASAANAAMTKRSLDLSTLKVLSLL